MKKIASLLLLFAITSQVCWAAENGGNTTYVGGTVDIKQGTEGNSSAKDEKAFVFEYKAKKERERFSILYDRIDSLEYGRKAGRLGAAILVNPLFIPSHKGKYYLTIVYTDGNAKQQAVVLEVGKDVVRTTLATLEAKSGRNIEYQDEEARNSVEARVQ